MDISKYVNATEAAAIIGVTPGRVRQLCIANELPGKKVSQRAWLIPRSAAERLAKKPPSGVGRPRISQAG